MSGSRNTAHPSVRRMSGSRNTAHLSVRRNTADLFDIRNQRFVLVHLDRVNRQFHFQFLVALRY